ncbi:MAG TPA: histidine kinase [Steroidobacteraceae bacterium]|nr:histidine kinase [Steroidobacteraceae bacterium]
MSLALILVIFWSVQQQARRILGLPLLGALGHLATALSRNTLSMLPAVPIMIFAINAAPRKTIARLGCLMPAIVLMAIWVSQFWSTDTRDPAWLTSVGQRMVAMTLLLIICLYRDSVRGASEILLRERIDNATLDAAVGRSRLELLRSQLEPHFLFNTLANVRTLARIDRHAAAAMLGDLMWYLRAALPRMRQETATLAEEMHSVEAYLRIHRIRMGRRLEYEMSLPQELEAVPVPTMMLLTLVENAVKHGINPSVSGGCIAVSAARRDSTLVLIVADSGRGMSADPMQGSGTGLTNLRLRLRMLYGASASIELSRARPRGVVAAISLPLARSG